MYCISSVVSTLSTTNLQSEGISNSLHYSPCRPSFTYHLQAEVDWVLKLAWPIVHIYVAYLSSQLGIAQMPVWPVPLRLQLHLELV
jgi:hypothetical protein